MISQKLDNVRVQVLLEGSEPDTKVAVAFGLLAARRYGTYMTLWQGLQGRGDPYRTLLREGTTAFLNSYNSLQFPYNANWCDPTHELGIDELQSKCPPHCTAVQESQFWLWTSLMQVHPLQVIHFLAL